MVEYSYSVYTVDKHVCALLSTQQLYAYTVSRLYTNTHTGGWGACKVVNHITNLICIQISTWHQNPQSTKHAGMKHSKIWGKRDEIYGQLWGPAGIWFVTFQILARSDDALLTSFPGVIPRFHSTHFPHQYEHWLFRSLKAVVGSCLPCIDTAQQYYQLTGRSQEWMHCS